MKDVRFAVLTASDKASTGLREDTSGRTIVDTLEGMGATLVEYVVLPDERTRLADFIRKCADELGVDLLLTTGGTGFTERDCTPEATMDAVDRVVPGIPEALRAEGLKKTPHAMLSRGIAGIRKKTLVINLPGSVKAVREGLELLARVLPHAMETLASREGVDCGS